MNSEKRREYIMNALKQTDRPISASKLAKELSVSRQIIVGDVALLRASGEKVLATPRLRTRFRQHGKRAEHHGR